VKIGSVTKAYNISVFANDIINDSIGNRLFSIIIASSNDAQ
jgi:hypothetical protein